jgi:hypothetical protein
MGGKKLVIKIKSILGYAYVGLFLNVENCHLSCFYHLVDCLLICVETMGMTFDYSSVRFLGCAMLCFYFSCCSIMEHGCCWQIGWSFCAKVKDKWNNFWQVKYLCLIVFGFDCDCDCLNKLLLH